MPVENTKYRGKQFLLGRQADLSGGTLSKALDISPFVSEFTLDDKPQTKEFTPIANAGQQAALATGAAKFSGTLNINDPRGLLVVLIASTYGRATSFGAKTASAWTTGTVTQVGDVVQHSGGKYLVAKKVYGSATTGATEPALTTETDYATVPSDGTLDGVDTSNGVVWTLRDELYTSAGHKTGFCTDEMVIIERAGEGCGSTEAFDTIVTGVELMSYNIAKSDGQINSEQSISFMARKGQRSSASDFEDITVTSTVALPVRYWSQDDWTIRVDGAKYGTLKSINFDFTRNGNTLDSVEPGEQIVDIDAPTFAGQGTLRLDPVEYENIKAVADKAVTISMDGGDGETALFTLPQVQFNSPSIERTGNEPIYMMFEARPIGNATTVMATVDIDTSTNWDTSL